MACSKEDEKKFEGGYELKTVDEDKDLECSICLLLLREAMGTPCSHAFCRVCLQKLIGQEDIRGATFKCPDCQQPVDSDKVYPIAFVDRLVRRSDVYCSRKDEGCEWTGTLASFIQEHNSECNFQIVFCHYEGCKFFGMKSKIKDHKSNCEHRMVNCEHCQADLKFILLNKHYLSCERIPTPCPQNGCDVIVSKIEIPRHLDQDCMFAIVSCSFAKFGCREKVSRKDLDQHNQESTNRHMAFMCDKLSTALSQNEDFQNEIKQLKSANGALQNEVKELSFFLTQFYPPFQLNKLLLRGVKKWIKKTENVAMEESYVEWYEKIFNRMEENKLYRFDSAMLIKLKNEKKIEIYWSSNSKEEQDDVSKSRHVYYRDKVNHHLLQLGINQLIVETETLSSFDFNSQIFVLHPSDVKKIVLSDDCSLGVDYNGWSIKNLADEFYVDDFAIVCLIKV